MSNDKHPGMMGTVELAAGLMLRNRFLWLTWAAALYLNLHLSFLQWRSGVFLEREWEMFQDMQLVIELALLVSAVIMLLSTPRLRAAWRAKYAGRAFSYSASGLAALLLLPLAAAALLAPLLVLHSYPSEAEAGISIPLMMLQRLLIILLSVALSYNCMLLLRYYARLPLWLAGICGIATQICLGYYLTALSHTNTRFAPYNDVFFYNQLWRHIDGFARLDNSTIFSRIELIANPATGTVYVGYGMFAGLALLAVIVSTLLWLPRTSRITHLEHKQSSSY